MEDDRAREQGQSRGREAAVKIAHDLNCWDKKLPAKIITSSMHQAPCSHEALPKHRSRLQSNR